MDATILAERSRLLFLVVVATVGRWTDPIAEVHPLRRDETLAGDRSAPERVVARSAS